MLLALIGGAPPGGCNASLDPSEKRSSYRALRAATDGQNVASSPAGLIWNKRPRAAGGIMGTSVRHVAAPVDTGKSSA
ncbi:MAG: hypothetical protein WBA33_01340 [Rhodanobacter lindaniclasticus]